MFTRLTVRHFAVAIVLTLGIVTVVSAQTNTPPSAPRGPMEELLAEVRSLRAEVRRAADTSIRAQLLVARLQLQEQRINSLTRQLVETQRQLSDNERARGAMAAPLAMFTRDDNQQSAEEREGSTSSLVRSRPSSSSWNDQIVISSRSRRNSRT